MNAALAALRPGKSLSSPVAGLFLDAWNTLDDVSRSIDRQLISVDLCTREDLDRVYEKLFYGSNLPAITPPGKKYSPLLDAQERNVLRNLFRCAVKKLVEWV